MGHFPYRYTGELVTHKRTGSTIYKITRVKQVKLLAITSGTGRSVEMRIEDTEDAPAGAEFVEVETSRRSVDAPDLAFGMAVRFRSPDAKTRGVFVVIGHTSAGWKVARLGGSEGTRHYYGLEANRLVPEDVINNVDWE